MASAEPARRTPDLPVGLYLASPEMQALVEKVATKTRVAPNTVLFRKDDEADCFFILDRGEIEISVMSADGRKLSLDILAPPAAFGEIGLFAGRRTADATALSAAQLRRVRRVDLMPQLLKQPELALQMIDLLCARLRGVSALLNERSFMPLPSRLARRLLHLADVYAAGGNSVPLSQADLADFVGATREAVAKTLAVWRDRGWIELSRGAVHLRNRSAIEGLAASDEE